MDHRDGREPGGSKGLPGGWIAAGLLLAGWLGWRLGRLGGRGAVDQVADWVTDIVTQDAYAENLLEVLVGFTRTGVLPLLEVDLRTGSRRPLKRPLGSLRKDWPHFDALNFDFAQLDRLPTPHGEPVETRAVIGPKAGRPLVVETPLLVSGMGYGVALSREAKIALARGASLAGTAVNTGEGPFLVEERRAADRLIMQYHRGNWMRLDDLAYADMVEIHLGQGASGGGGKVIPPEEIDDALRYEMGLGPGEDAISYARFAEMASGKDLEKVVEKARRHAPEGVPAGVKIAAGHSIERDLEIALDAGVDFVAVDGAQAGTHGSLPITEDDFGLPTLIALCRARAFLEEADPKRTVSLIVGGGLATAGDCLKALALGADAVYLGSAAMYALVVGQHVRSTPWEPPTSLITYRGRNKERFDPDAGAERVANLLISMTCEMADAARAMGYTSLRQVSRKDLFAFDRTIAEFCGVSWAFEAKRPALRRLGR